MINDLTKTNTELQKSEYKNVNDLPESMRIYTLSMSNKATYSVAGDEKEAIMESKTNFIELRSGHIINKAFIVDIFWDKSKTVEQYRKLYS